MEPVLDEQQTLLRDSAARLARELGGAKRARHLRERGEESDAAAWAAIAEAGWLGIAVPEAQGGLGMGLFELGLAFEEAGRHLLAGPVLEASAAAWALARTAEASEMLPLVLEGTLSVVPALGESGWSTPTLPTLSDGVLRGSVRHVAYAPSAKLYLVAADADGGPALCTVAADAHGLALETAANVDGSTSSELRFDGAGADMVARGSRAGELIERLREFLALGASAQLVGITQASLDLTLEHLKVRQQFGKPLGSFQGLQFRCADMFVDIELNRSLVSRVCAAWDAGQAHPAMASAAKARTTRCTRDITRNALQLHGAIGYTDEHDIGLYYKRGVVLCARYGNESNHASHFSRLTLA